MARKLIKYGKFLMSVALIFGLLMSSYAALSNTDGSSFVTKAEFDSALADFNARLTTFEAGINSKIDSQVTSYLDRNGIWSGKKQVLVTPRYIFVYGAALTKDLTYVDGVVSKPTVSGWPTMPTFVAGKQQIIKDKEYLLVDKVDKTGLCRIDYAVYANGDYIVGKSGNVKRSWKIDQEATRNNVLIWDTNFYIYQPDGWDIADREIAKAKGRFKVFDAGTTFESNSDETGIFIQPFSSAGSLYFFCKKDKPLYFVDFIAVSFNLNWSASSISGKGSTNWGDEDTGWRVDFNNVSVY